jgi:hypothetical protein
MWPSPSGEGELRQPFVDPSFGDKLGALDTGAVCDVEFAGEQWRKGDSDHKMHVENLLVTAGGFLQQSCQDYCHAALTLQPQDLTDNDEVITESGKFLTKKQNDNPK